MQKKPAMREVLHWPRYIRFSADNTLSAISSLLFIKYQTRTNNACKRHCATFRATSLRVINRTAYLPMILTDLKIMAVCCMSLDDLVENSIQYDGDVGDAMKIN